MCWPAFILIFTIVKNHIKFRGLLLTFYKDLRNFNVRSQLTDSRQTQFSRGIQRLGETTDPRPVCMDCYVLIVMLILQELLDRWGLPRHEFQD